jgi:hypothetical protein
MNVIKNIVNFFRSLFETLYCKNNKNYVPLFNDELNTEYTKLPDIENIYENENENERYAFTNWDNFMIR